MRFIQRVTDDFKQKKLLSMKLIFFVQSSTLLVLYPYLTIHMRELGLNVEETAIMSALTPVVTIIMPPIAGMIADFIGNFKVLLAMFSALGGVSSLLLLLVPVGRVTVVYPEQAVFRIGCFRDTGPINLALTGDYGCDALQNSSNIATLEVNGQIESCGLLCRRSSETSNPVMEDEDRESSLEEARAILRARSYVIQRTLENREDIYQYTLSPNDISIHKPQVFEDPDVRNGRILKNSGRFTTAIRQLSEDTFFFPAKGLISFSCSYVGKPPIYLCQMTKTIGNLTRNFDSPVYFEGGMQVNTDDRAPEWMLSSLRRWNYDDQIDFIKSTCVNPKPDGVLNTVSIPLLNPENNLEVQSNLNFSNCRPECLATMERKSVCSNLGKVVEYDPKLTFWFYLTVRVFIAMIGGTGFAMFEGAVIAILREEKADYGLQRMYASIGGMISSPLAGLLIDYASKGKGYTDFRPAFYFYAGLKGLTAFLMLTINLKFKSPAKNVVADVVHILKKIEIQALFIATLILGAAWGYIESFLFWLLQDLGASRALMGATITVGGIAGLPLLALSGPIIEKIGHANVIFIGFLFYSVRLLGYSIITAPWQCLIFEAMESVTSSLAFTALVTYAAKLSNMSTDSSIQGLLGGIYFGVGKGAGGLAGGLLMKYFGSRATYRIFALVLLISGCMYFLFNKLCIVGKGMNESSSDLSDVKKVNLPSTETSALKNGASGKNGTGVVQYYVNECLSVEEVPDKPDGEENKLKGDKESPRIHGLNGVDNLALEDDDGLVETTRRRKVSQDITEKSEKR